MNINSSRWLAGIGALILVLIIISVFIAVLRPGGSMADYPPDSPEGVVQRYLQAITEGDPVLALSLMEAEAREGCTVQEVTQQSQWFVDNSGRRRIELVETRDLSDGAKQVRIRVTEVNVSPPFGINENSYEQWYTLIEEDGAWLLQYAAWPISWCQGLQDKLRGPQ